MKKLDTLSDSSIQTTKSLAYLDTLSDSRVQTTKGHVRIPMRVIYAPSRARATTLTCQALGSVSLRLPGVQLPPR